MLNHARWSRSHWLAITYRLFFVNLLARLGYCSATGLLFIRLVLIKLHYLWNYYISVEVRPGSQFRLLALREVGVRVNGVWFRVLCI
jgi:hypothetical protein